MNRVEGKVVLITGGGSGIGAATAELVCAEGGKVMLVDADAGALADTTKGIVDRMPRAHAASFVADVAEAAAATRAVERALEQFGHLDVLVTPRCATLRR